MTKGIYFALLTAVISGVSIFINKFAVETFPQPLVFTTAKNIGVALLLVGILVATHKLPILKKLTKKEIFYLVLVGLIGGSLPFYLFFTGISQIPALNAALIHKTLVLWVIIFAIPLLHEKLTKTQVFAIALLFAGNLVIGGFKGFLFTQGELLILAATILWALETVVAKKVLTTVHPNIVAASRMCLGALVLLLAAFFTGTGDANAQFGLTTTHALWLGVTVIFLLGYVLSWYHALKLAPAITVTAVLVSSTLVTNLLTAVFVTHTWNFLLTLQTVLVICGMLLFWYSLKKDVGTDTSAQLY